MKSKQRIQRGPKGPSLFRSPLFYLFIVLLLSLIALYQFTGRRILRELRTKNLSNHLCQEAEALNHLLYHQFFILGLKGENVKFNLKKMERGNVSWNLYQMKVQLPSGLPSPEVKDSLEKQVRLSLPDLSLKSQLLNHGELHVTIKKEEFILGELTFTSLTSVVSPKESTASVKGKIALVIDDLGPNLSVAREFFTINYPFTFSILPFYPHSKEIGKEAHSLGREVILHLPLEPKDKQDIKPEKGILYTWMDEDKILAQLAEDLSAIPYVRGVNGHMGSKFTEDRICMEVLLNDLKSQGLYFLDSLTTPKTLGSIVAHHIGVRFRKRDIFIDRDLGQSTIEDRLLQLSKLSKKRGYAIGIAHPQPDTINTLKKMLPIFSSQGIEVVPLSEIIDHPLSR